MSEAIAPASKIVVGEEVLPADVALGRRLFYSAITPQMTDGLGGVSCSTCHFDGRNDGLTWQLLDGPRQTPSLAGEVSLTAPVTWTGNVAGVADEAALTSEERMNGTGLSAVEESAIAA